MQYLKYFPLEIGRLESGLTLYCSVFSSADGSTGVIAGPHPSFTEVNRASHFAFGQCYYSSQVRAYLNFISNRNDVPLLGYRSEITTADDFLDDHKNSHEFCDFGLGEGEDLPEGHVYASKRAPQNLKVFEEIERAGTLISYRCCDCRECPNCLRPVG